MPKGADSNQPDTEESVSVSFGEEAPMLVKYRRSRANEELIESRGTGVPGAKGGLECRYRTLSIRGPGKCRSCHDTVASPPHGRWARAAAGRSPPARAVAAWADRSGKPPAASGIRHGARLEQGTERQLEDGDEEKKWSENQVHPKPETRIRSRPYQDNTGAGSRQRRPRREGDTVVVLFQRFTLRKRRPFPATEREPRLISTLAQADHQAAVRSTKSPSFTSPPSGRETTE